MEKIKGIARKFKDLTKELFNNENIHIEARGLSVAYFSAMISSFTAFLTRIFMGADLKLIFAIIGITAFTTASVYVCHIFQFYDLGAILTIIIVSAFACSVIMRQRKLYNNEIKKTVEANRAKSDFIAKMSHEIRAQTNAIIGMAELAMREDTPSAGKDYIYMVRQSSQNLQAILNDALDISKIELGKMEINTEEYMPATLLNDVIHLIRIQTLDSRLRFLVNADSRIPGVLFGDAAKIRSVLINLLSNAVKYTESGFISVNVTSEPPNGGIVILKIEVADSGRGIKTEDNEKLFREFSKLDAGNNTHIDGSGLGLAITKNFVTAMGGKISFKSEFGSGSVFTASIPQKYSPGAPMAAVDEPWNKFALIYERRALSKSSVSRTMEDLGVKFDIASSLSEFHTKITVGSYTHVFIPSVLYAEAICEYPDIDSDAYFILISEFGETTLHPNAGILMTPVFSLPAAHFLNGASGSYIGNLERRPAATFTAPDARVLAVDDNATNLEVTEGYLQPYGIRTDLLNNGAEALEAVKLNRYDLIFMDHMMPGINGIEIIERIRALPADGGDYFANLPVVALTANIAYGVNEALMNAGFSDILSKPIDLAKLNAVLEKWIPREKQRRSADGFAAASATATDGAAAAPDTFGLSRDASGTATETYSANLDIEGLDAEKGIKRTNGAPGDFYKTLRIFMIDGRNKIREIKSCLDSGDIGLFTIHVHALKASCANVGADGLSEAALTLEQAGIHNDLLFIKENAERFILGMGRMLEDIQNALDADARRRGNGPADAETLKRSLPRLRSELESLNIPAAREISGSLLNNAYEPGISAGIDGIVRMILCGDYEGAIMIINELTAGLSDNPD